MALPTDDEVTAYLRLDTAVESNLITELNRSAQAVITQYLRMPLDQEIRTFEGRYPRMGLRREFSEQLVVPGSPCNTSATITDLDGAEVDSATYTVDGRRGLVNAVRFTLFTNPPYTIQVGIGLALDPNYFDQVEPILRQAVLHICSDFYNRRNSGAIYEQSGGQVSVTYTADQIPPVIKLELDLLRPRGNPF